MNGLIYLDNLDDRREIHRLLQRLPPAKRIQWLRWCCRQCVLPHSRLHPEVPPDHKGSALEVYFDFVTLLHTHRLDPKLPTELLEALARKV